MLKKLNTKTLVILLSVLVAIVLLTKIFDDKKGGRTFKEELVTLDTSLVNVILVYPASQQKKEIKLSRSGEIWMVQSENISSEADSSYARNLIGTFSVIKTIRLAATEKSKWKDFNVDDSLGTKVKFLSGEKVLAEIVVGKFSYNQMSRSGISYVRLPGEDNVYAVDGFLPMAVNQQFNEWRNKNILRGNKEDWKKISFSYPDSSFYLEKENDKWKLKSNGLSIEGVGETDMTDTVKIEQFINSFSNLSNSSFVDNYSPSVPASMTVTVEGNNMASPVSIKAFLSDSASKLIVNSSFNPKSYFMDEKGSLSERIFKKFTDFLKTPVPAEEIKGKKK